MTGPVIFTFAGGPTGEWRVDSVQPVIGDSLDLVDRLAVQSTTAEPQAVWTLRGQTSNIRYAARDEVTRLRERQEGLGRPQATCAALIPIRKTPAWWDLAQDERRAIMEEESRHVSVGMEYLPAVSRRLFHSRDLGEPFDFLTWFEYAPEHAQAFETLVLRLRDTPEWDHVEREVDIRLIRDPV